MKKLRQQIKNNWLACVIICLSTLVFLMYELLSYWKFRFPVSDLGMYNRHLWGMVRFDFGANPLKGFNLLGDHSHFILLLLAPFYALFQSPIFLSLIQVLCITLSGWPIYLIANKYFSNKTISALWLLPYFSYFGFASALAWPFHVAPLSILPISWALYFLLNKKIKPLIITLFILLLIKEDMPLLIIMFGLYLIFFYRKYLLGVGIIAISGIYFVFITKYWLPHISQIPYYYSDAGDLGNNWGEALMNSLKNPLLFLKSFFEPLRKTYSMIYMLVSFGGLSLLAPEILFLLSPLWLSRFINTQAWRWSTSDHYSASQGPILIVAAIIATYRIGQWLKPKIDRKIILVIATMLVYLGCAITNILIVKKPLLELFKKDFYLLSPAEQIAHQAIKKIPVNASVGVQSPFPQLSSRREIYNMPDVFPTIKPDYILLSSKLDYWPFCSPEKVIDFKNTIIHDYGYSVVVESEGVYLLQKPNTP